MRFLSPSAVKCHHHASSREWYYDSGGFPYRTPLRKKFDIGMNGIEHKIGIAVKKDCQVAISPLLQHMLGFKRAIFPHADHVADVTRGINYLYVYPFNDF
jgi:hypothetical protein